MDIYNALKPVLLFGLVVIAGDRVIGHYGKNETKDTWVTILIDGVLAITTLINALIIFVFKLYTVNNSTLTWGFALLVGTLVGVYQLNKVFKVDDLPFETTVKYALTH